MNDRSETVTMAVKFVDGSRKAFEFEPDPDLRLVIASRLKEILHQPTLAIQTEDSLMIYPMSRVESIELCPAPGGVPEGVFTNAREIRTDL